MTEGNPLSIFDLDLAELGGALLTACVVSRQLGHGTVGNTVRDYIAPHGPYGAEHEFVYGALLGVAPEALISEDDLVAWMNARSWTEPAPR